MALTYEMEHTCDSRPIYSSLAEDGEYDLAFLSTLVTPIPCRPGAVNISNVAPRVDSEGNPHFKYIVEGANLFFTQQARFYLHNRKVLLFKDSHAPTAFFPSPPFALIPLTPPHPHPLP